MSLTYKNTLIYIFKYTIVILILKFDYWSLTLIIIKLTMHIFISILKDKIVLICFTIKIQYYLNLLMY